MFSVQHQHEISPLVVDRSVDVRIELFHDSGLFIPTFSYIEICVPFYPHSSGMRTFRFFLFLSFSFWILLLNRLNAPNSGLRSDIRKFIKSKGKIEKEWTVSESERKEQWFRNSMQWNHEKLWFFFEIISCPKFVDGLTAKVL